MVFGNLKGNMKYPLALDCNCQKELLAEKYHLHRLCDGHFLKCLTRQMTLNQGNTLSLNHINCVLNYPYHRYYQKELLFYQTGQTWH